MNSTQHFVLLIGSVCSRLLNAVSQLRLMTLASCQCNVGEELQQLAGRWRWSVGGLGSVCL